MRYSKKYKIFADYFFISGILMMIFGLLEMLFKGVSSLGLGIISFGIGVLSLGLGFDSTAKLTANANKSFLEIFDIFEDKRIYLTQHNMRGDFRKIIEACWKCKGYSSRAIALKDDFMIDKENQFLFFEQLIQLVHHSGMPWQGVKIQITKGKNKGKFKTVFPIRKKDAAHILMICENVSKFDLDDKKNDDLKELTKFIKQFT